MFENYNFSSVQFLGMINALKTGDPAIDTLAAIVLPIVLGKLARELPRHLEFLWNRKQRLTDSSYTRTIVYRSTDDINGNSKSMDEGTCNIFLIRAIQLYVHSQRPLRHLKDADLELTSIDSSKVASSAQQRRNIGLSTKDMLALCEIVERPLQRKWHDIGMFDGHSVQVWLEDNISDSGKGKSDKSSSVRTTELKLRSSGLNSISQFVDAAYLWYKLQLKDLDSNQRYFFDLASNSRSRHNQGSASYRAYKLGDEKTFESLFNHQCESLLKLVDQFQEKTGKYAIPGYPYKLGLLLSGPPGTGKTSLIKALAHYTKRHIVNVPLARISYNSELMNVFYNHTYHIPGHPQETRLNFDQVIFVLEDVDAASDAVKRRAKQKRKRSPNKPAIVPTSPRDQEDAEIDANNTVESILEKLSPPQKQATSPFGAPARSTAHLVVPDELNLSGILNVLDGVVDTPGRIVIMTSNHPEVLDPALVRPGRIDKMLELSYMVSSDMVKMMEHYYQTKLTPSERAGVEQVMADGLLKITPAQVEQLAMERENVPELIEELEWRRKQGADDDDTESLPAVTEAESSDSTEHQPKKRMKKSGED